MDMIDDYIREQGYLTLGSRLKRLGERLQADVQRLAKSEGLDLPPALFPTIGVLDHHGVLTVGEVAQALGISQPGATRNIRELAKLGLVKSTPSTGDRRAKALQLTDKCRRLIQENKKDMWPRVERAVSDLCAGLKGDLLNQLTRIEEELNRVSLDRRAARPRKVK